jgi:uncharacterized protein (DUF433 family)
MTTTMTGAMPAASPLNPDHNPELIVKNASICGGAARLIRTRIPVWTLARMRQLGESDDNLLQSYPTLEPVDLLHAWRYVELHPDEIDQAMRENEDA